MATQTENTPKAPKADKAEKGERRRTNITLEGAGGAMLRITTHKREPNTVVAYATHIVKTPSGKTQKTKGASSVHPSTEEAKSASDKLVANAIKLGWTIKKSAGGFRSKPDAFDAAHLPAPRK